jgi:hypothetical protein
MLLQVEDRLQITDLITGLIHRDLGEWDKLRDLFHHDSEIEVTWFEGSLPSLHVGRSPSKRSTDSRLATPMKGRAARSKMPCILSKTFKLRI